MELRFYDVIFGILEQTVLLWRIRQTHDSVMALVKKIEIGGIGYHTVLSRMYMYRNRVCVLDDNLLRKGILQ